MVQTAGETTQRKLKSNQPAAHGPTVSNFSERGERILSMFCGNNYGSLWIIIILILLFGCGGFGGSTCGCGNNNCGCGNDCGCGC